MATYQTHKTRSTRTVSVTIDPTMTNPQLTVLKRLWQRDPQAGQIGQNSQPRLTSRWTRAAK